MSEKVLSTRFVPIGIAKSEQDSYIVMMEGQAFPFLGLASRPDKAIYVHKDPSTDKVDHSAEARNHAQKIINFFIDQARLNNHEVGVNFKQRQASNLKKVRLDGDSYFVL